MVGLCVRESYYRRSRRRPESEPLEARLLMATAPLPAGAEFRVNSHMTGSQELFAEAPHAVAADADGDFIVTWSSSGQDGDAWGVYAQRYAADGASRGPEFRVNQDTANSQWYPNVASSAGGDFVIVWTSSLQDGSGDGVFARRYDAGGAPLGDEFRVNATTEDHQRHSTVAMDPAGAFVVVWSGYGQAGVADWDIYAQRYGASGEKQGDEFRVNGTTAGQQQFPSLAVDAQGRFVVAWTTDGQDGSGTAVYGRQYDADGTSRGEEFQVNTETAGNQQYARVAAAAGGDFVVAWASANQDGSGRGVFAQRFTAAGARRGGEFQVNQVSTGEQFAPTVAADAAGGFVVTWTGAQDGDMYGVFARAYNAGGEARGSEFRVNTEVAGNQVYSAAASDAAGGIVIVWQSDGQDGSSFGVYGQRYAPPARVVGRHVFYNGSSFDGRDSAAGPADDDAIAPDKQAFLPGAVASFANYTSYPFGINGIMVDFAGRGADALVPTIADFQCRVGNSRDRDLWRDAPPPLSVTVRAGAGTGGSDRVTLIWEDDAILREWVQVTVLASAASGLAAPDVFFFGNLPGDTGDVSGTAEVNRSDFFLTRAAAQDGPAALSNRFDHDRNGRVDVRDLAVIRAGISHPPLELIAPIVPTPAAFAPRRSYRPVVADVGLVLADEVLR